jgi:hypothetical protein
MSETWPSLMPALPAVTSQSRVKPGPEPLKVPTDHQTICPRCQAAFARPVSPTQSDYELDCLGPAVAGQKDRRWAQARRPRHRHRRPGGADRVPQRRVPCLRAAAAPPGGLLPRRRQAAAGAGPNHQHQGGHSPAPAPRRGPAAVPARDVGGGPVLPDQPGGPHMGRAFSALQRRGPSGPSPGASRLGTR